MNEREVIGYALANVQNEGVIEATWNDTAYNDKIVATDGTLILKFQEHLIRLNAEIKDEIRNNHLQKIEYLAENYAPFIIIARRIYPKIKQALRAMNIAYLEANGNIFLNHNGAFIYTDGNGPIETKEKNTNRAFTKTGLKVIYQFLVDPLWANYPYREIAQYTGTGIGNLSNIFNGLKQEGFMTQLNRNEVRLENRQQLLERWVQEYDKKLKPALTVGTFKFIKEMDFYNWREVPINKNTCWWGGEPAGDYLTNYLRPEELTLYTTENRNELMKNYRLVPDIQGNVRIYNKFWAQDTPQNNIVHPILAYADLINTGDRRCIETAKRIYDEYLQNNI